MTSPSTSGSVGVAPCQIQPGCWLYLAVSASGFPALSQGRTNLAPHLARLQGLHLRLDVLQGCKSCALWWNHRLHGCAPCTCTCHVFRKIRKPLFSAWAAACAMSSAKSARLLSASATARQACTSSAPELSL